MKEKYEAPKILSSVVITTPAILASSSSSDEDEGGCNCGCGPECCHGRGDCKGNGIGGCNHKDSKPWSDVAF